MGDTSGIKAGNIKAEGVVPAAGECVPAQEGRVMAAWRWMGSWAGRMWRWVRSWFIRHWRGELSLPVSYWINTAVASLTTYGVIWLARKVGVNHADLPRTFAAVWAFCWAMSTWTVVGIWRSAGRYTGPLIWPFLARLMIILSVLEVMSRFVPKDLPSLD